MSRQTPQIDPAQLLPPTWDAKHDVLLIVGENAGSIAAPFVDYGLKRVICMFPDPLEIEAVPNGARCVTSRGALTRTVNLFPGTQPRRFATIRTPSCSLDIPTTKGLQTLLGQLVQQKSAFRHAQDHLAPLWAHNGLRNLPHIGQHPMVTDIGDQLKDVPLIIVGAGPSLEKNIDQLRAAQGKTIILAVNRTLRSLQNAGVCPDFVINLEPRDVACQFEGIDLQNITGLVLSVTSHPTLFHLDVPNLLTFAGNLEAEQWLFDAEDNVVEIASRGTVSCSAMSLALQWKCNPIILVGQDLSFPGGAYYHAGGADGATQAEYDEDEKRWVLKGYSEDLANTLRAEHGSKPLSFEGTEVPGYFGGTVPTSTAFATFRSWFENTALDHPNRELYNCTEGGAFIDGMKHVPLSVALRDLPPRDIELPSLLSNENLSKVVAARQQRMAQRAASIHTGLQEAMNMALDCIKLIDRCQNDPKKTGKLQAAEAELSKLLKSLSILSLMDQRKIREAAAEGKKATTFSEALGASRKLYGLIVEESRRLL